MSRLPALIALALTFAAAAVPAPAAELLIRHGKVLTMDPALGDLDGADVHLRDGRIVAVGHGLQAPGAEVIDARGQIVLPGFVDTHSHLYITTLRGRFRNGAGKFFPVSSALTARMLPGDTRTAMHLGALQLMEGGTTTTADFFDNVLSPAHADAGWAALQASGIGGILYYGGPDKTTRHPIDLTDLRRLAERAAQDAGRLQVGLAWRLPRDRTDAANWAMRDREFKHAQAQELPVQVHVSGEPGPMFDALIARGYLQPRVTVVHATDASPTQLQALQAAGAGVSLTPLSEHRVGYGLTRVDDFAGVARRGLGIDGNPLAGTADMYATMRMAALTWSGETRDETAPDPRALLALATREGALTLGLQDEVGRLVPGLRADLQIVDPRGLNLAGFDGGDPAALLVYDVRPDNVRTVIAGGRLVKHEGRMLDPALPALLEAARATSERLDAPVP